MTTPKNNTARARLWVALGNQPGVSTWFAVWSLARESRSPQAGEHNNEAREAEDCMKPAERNVA